MEKKKSRKIKIEKKGKARKKKVTNEKKWVEAEEKIA